MNRAQGRYLVVIYKRKVCYDARSLWKDNYDENIVTILLRINGDSVTQLHF